MVSLCDLLKASRKAMFRPLLFLFFGWRLSLLPTMDKDWGELTFRLGVSFRGGIRVEVDFLFKCWPESLHSMRFKLLKQRPTLFGMRVAEKSTHPLVVEVSVPKYGRMRTCHQLRVEGSHLDFFSSVDLFHPTFQR